MYFLYESNDDTQANICVCHRKHFRHDHVLGTDTNNDHRPEVSQMGESRHTRERVVPTWRNDCDSGSRPL